MPEEPFSLDFTELGPLDRAGHGLQALVGEIGERLGYNVIRGGMGPDRGRDLIFEITVETVADKKENFRWLVQCKDHSATGKSVTPSDLGDAYSRTVEHHCHGLLLVTTTKCTDQVVEQFRSFEEAKSPIKTMIWDRHILSKILAERQNDLFRFTLARFFPKSGGLSDRTTRMIEQIIKLIDETSGDVSSKIELLCDFGSNLEDSVVQWALIDRGLDKLKPSLDSLYPVLDLYMKQLESGHDSELHGLNAFDYVSENLEELVRSKLNVDSNNERIDNSAVELEEYSHFRQGSDVVLEFWGWTDLGINFVAGDTFLGEARFGKNGCTFSCRLCSRTEVEQAARRG